jgi:hypothetical protein
MTPAEVDAVVNRVLAQLAADTGSRVDLFTVLDVLIAHLVVLQVEEAHRDTAVAMIFSHVTAMLPVVADKLRKETKQ